MFSIKIHKVKLVPRNEGKVKSFESCADVRAWSHDIETQDRYLRDWIKSDMPVCVIPINTVSSALRMMSWRRRGKVAARCHPECKSKVLLDSIYNSCHVIKECCKENEEFTKYFEEEEFETSHWPCDRCLDALKSIKLFWKIILDKIFKVKFPNDNEFHIRSHSNQNVKNIAIAWQKDLVEQAIFVKNLSPFINDQLNSKSNGSLVSELKHDRSQMTLHMKTNNDISTNTDVFVCNTRIKRQNSASSCKKLSRCTSVRIKTIDVGCGTCAIDNEEVDMYRNNLDYLQQQFNLQNDELKQLRKENMSLKLELRNSRNNSIPSYTPVLPDSNLAVAPTPFESFYEERDTDSVKDIDSEMVITLKNCKNKNFRHVSLLQVLHKTNSLTLDNFNTNCSKRSEDPIDVLTKVHNTFGAIVKKELTIANKKKANLQDNNDTYKRMKIECDRNCSSKTSHCTISDSIFVSYSISSILVCPNHSDYK